jgi:hypothetical protein
VGTRLFVTYINDFGFAQAINSIEDGHVVDAHYGEDMLDLKLS